MKTPLSARLPLLDLCDEPALTPMDSPHLDWFGVHGCVVGRAVDVFAARVFTDFGKPGLGMFLK